MCTAVTDPKRGSQALSIEPQPTDEQQLGVIVPSCAPAAGQPDGVCLGDGEKAWGCRPTAPIDDAIAEVEKASGCPRTAPTMLSRLAVTSSWRW